MSKYIEVTAHRGCKGYIPENTAISFREALKYDVDYIEYDVHMSLDGELVVMHDSLVARTCGEPGALDFMTLAEIKKLDAGSTLYGEEFKGTEVPTLRETLEIVAACERPVRQVVEIKDFRAVVADKIIDMLKEFGLLERSVIECGDAQVLMYIHKLHPEIELMAFPPVSMKRLDGRIYDFVKYVSFSLFSTKLGSDADIKALMDEYRAKGIRIWMFSGDDEEQVDRCLSFDADNITSNFPKKCLDILTEKGHR